MKRSSSHLRSLLPLLIALLLLVVASVYVSRATSSAVNTDNDTQRNMEDRDDDGDGIPTAVEDANGDGNPTNDDRDGDNIANYLDNADCSINDIDYMQQWLYDFSSFVGAGDGALELMLRTPKQDRTVTVTTDYVGGFDSAENTPNQQGEPQIHFYQIDQTITISFAPSLNDSIQFELHDANAFTATLTSPTQHQSSGTITQTIIATVTNNNITIVIDAAVDDATQHHTLRIPNVHRDSDGDTIPDHIDLDDDQDGLLDTVEDANVSNVCDSDNDGLPDSRDSDSDGDGIADNVEAQYATDYIAPSGKDNNRDGVDDAYNNLQPVNSDGADMPDYVDLDANNNNTPDNAEVGYGDSTDNNDGDGDGIVNGFDAVSEAQIGASFASIQNNVTDPASLPAWQATCVDAVLHNGWNLIAAGVDATEMDRLTLFPNVQSPAYAYDETGYIATDTLQLGAGYWMLFDTEDTVSVCGKKMTGQKQISVTAGWNIVAVYDEPVPIANINGNLASSFFGYNGNQYVSATALLPGHAYWIKSDDATSLTWADSAPRAAEETDSADCPLDWGATITVQDSEKTQTLNFGTSPQAHQGRDAACGEEELPPLAPGGLEARFRLPTDITTATDIRPSGDASWEIMLNNVTTGVHIHWDRNALASGDTYHLQDALGGSILNVDMLASDSATLPDGLTQLKIVYTNVPTAISLDEQAVNTPVSMIVWIIVLLLAVATLLSQYQLRSGRVIRAANKSQK